MFHLTTPCSGYRIRAVRVSYTVMLWMLTYYYALTIICHSIHGSSAGVRVSYSYHRAGCQWSSHISRSGGNGTHIVGWTGETGQDSAASHQQWLFEKLSQTSDDVHAALSKSPSLRQDFQSYLEDGLCVEAVASSYMSHLTVVRLDIWSCHGKR